jgi:hypothetical protein
MEIQTDCPRSITLLPVGLVLLVVVSTIMISVSTGKVGGVPAVGDIDACYNSFAAFNRST